MSFYGAMAVVSMSRRQEVTQEEAEEYLESHPNATVGELARWANMPKARLNELLERWGHRLPDPASEGRSHAHVDRTDLVVKKNPDPSIDAARVWSAKLPSDTISERSQSEILREYVQDHGNGKATHPRQTLDRILDEWKSSKTRIAAHENVIQALEADRIKFTERTIKAAEKRADAKIGRISQRFADRERKFAEELQRAHNQTDELRRQLVAAPAGIADIEQRANDRISAADQLAADANRRALETVRQAQAERTKQRADDRRELRSNYSPRTIESADSLVAYWEAHPELVERHRSPGEFAKFAAEFTATNRELLPRLQSELSDLKLRCAEFEKQRLSIGVPIHIMSALRDVLSEITCEYLETLEGSLPVPPRRYVRLQSLRAFLGTEDFNFVGLTDEEMVAKFERITTQARRAAERLKSGRPSGEESADRPLGPEDGLTMRTDSLNGGSIDGETNETIRSDT